jgi:hypothetical protein
MPPTPNDALVDYISKEQFEALVNLYDKFAHSIDPFDRENDAAEKAFETELISWYDGLPVHPKPSFRDFQKAVIWRCKQQIIKANKKPRSP